MKKAILVIPLLLLTLTGCGVTLEERIEQRDKCEAAEGRWVERMSEVNSVIANCILERSE